MTLPYEVGAILNLQRHGIDEHFRARILKVYKPFTMSCVMKIEYQEGSMSPSQAILKLYDRRFFPRLRKENDFDSWSDQTEAKYIDFVRSGGATEFMKELKGEDNKEERFWHTRQFETYLYHYSMEMFEDETKVYDALTEYQGAEVPILLGSVKLIYLSSCLPNVTAEHAHFFQIPGILLEIIDGVTFSEMKHKIPRTAWQDLVNQAIRITHIFSDHNILNEDVQRRNIIATPDESKECGYRAVMIDFGCCRFRREDESNDKWGRAKLKQDEEGKLAELMTAKLNYETGFELAFKPSNRYAEYDYAWSPAGSEPEPEP